MAGHRIVGPRRAGGRYFDAYWRVEYTVESVNEDGSLTVTHHWSQHAGNLRRDDKTVTHRTPWAYGRDRVVG